MLFSFLVHILYFSIPAVASIPHAVYIAGENELEQFLCRNNNPLEQDTLVVLSTSITHYISSNISLCVINTTYSLTLTTDSSSPAVIQCHQTSNLSYWPTTGFVFTNVHSLTIQRLVFTGCGGFLKNSTIIDIINSTDSPFYFTQNQSAVLLFLHVKILCAIDMQIKSYYGFALLVINPLNTTVNKVTVALSLAASKHLKILFDSSIGSGILILFTDSLKVLPSFEPTAVINDSAILFNTNCFPPYIWSGKDKRLPIDNVAGITTIFSQTKFQAKLLAKHIIFYEVYGGAMLLLHYKTSLGETLVSNTFFYNNHLTTATSCQSHASGIALVMILISSVDLSNPLLIDNSRFKGSLRQSVNNNSQIYIGIYMYDPIIGPHSGINVVISNTKFINNNIKTTGSCLYARIFYTTKHALNIILNNITAYNNAQTNFLSTNARAGMFTLFNAGVLSITGVNTFYDNFGSVFEVTDTTITMAGNITFTRNRGEKGPAFKLLDNSQLYLAKGLNAIFIENTALKKGGAIFAYDDSSDKCTFMINASNISQVHITFINNTAGDSGSSIYSNSLYHCENTFGTILDATELSSIYKAIFSFVSYSHLNNMSNPNVELFFCSNNGAIYSIDSDQSVYTMPIYPGQIVELPLVARDVIKVAQYATVSFAIGYQYYNKKYEFPPWTIDGDDVNQVLLEGNNCTTTELKLLKKENKGDRPHTVLTVTAPYGSSIRSLSLNLSGCPLGFELDARSGSCHCSKFLYYIGVKPNDCQISSITNKSIPVIRRPILTWFGFIVLSNGTTVTGAAGTCYLHCKLNTNYTVFVVNSTSVTIADPSNPSNSISPCLDNREGPLCSQCSPGYSVVFASNECKQCSNWWLLILIVYAVTGPLFICLLYALRLTLTTGTLNGIIFCAQMFQVIDLPSPTYSKISIVTRSFLYIVFYYPHCFYNGMTEVWKSIIVTIYPLYLILILLSIVALSRFSVRISNRLSGSSIQVLVTVIHLSFSRLLISIIGVFTPISIYTNTSEVLHVWFRDATLEYGSGSHLVLMIITLVIVVPILGVYMTVLLAGRPLMRINYRIREYLRPVYEAIHAPYKRNKEFFFVARLLIILMIYFIYILFREGDLYMGFAIASPILTTYTALEGLCRPFRKMSLNIFNFILLSVASIAYGSGWYFIKSNKGQGVLTIYSMLSAMVTISLFGVFVLHILWVTGLLNKLMLKRQKFGSLLSRRKEEALPVDMSGSFFERCDRVREPLLSSYHAQYN